MVGSQKQALQNQVSFHSNYSQKPSDLLRQVFNKSQPIML